MDLYQIYHDPLLYDAEFASRTEDIAYYERYASGRSGSILEVGCGSGRLTIPIAKRGVDIVGIDLVPTMIERAKYHAAVAGISIPFLVRDCRSFNLDCQFSTILCAANTVQHLLCDRDAMDFFSCALRHCEKDGYLVVEAFNPNPEKLRGSNWHLKKTFMFKGNFIEVWSKSVYQASKQILTFTYSYRVKEKELHHKEISIRCLSHGHVKSLLEESGWYPTHIHGCYNESSFTNTSPLQIIHCKPGA